MKEVVENFSDIVGYDLTSFLLNYADFIEQDRSSIVDFYQGNIDTLPSTSLDNLKDLLYEVNKVDELFYSNKDSFDTADFNELIDMIGDIKLNLLTIDNTSKWVRSSVTNNGYTSNIEMSTTLNQNQTLEQLAKSVGYLNEDDDWIEMALRNDVAEEDYTSQSGLKLEVSLQNNLKINIISVVDTIQGESIYGRDLQKKLEFEDDDLKSLDYKPTIEQAFEIAINLRRGDNPEFPDDGLQSSLIVGQNLNSILYPSIFRQIYQSFAKDDTFRDISILDIKQLVDDSRIAKDMVQLRVQASTRINEVLQDLILI